MGLFRRRSVSWEQEKMALLADAVADHDNCTQTCLLCDLPIRLHPPGRTLSAKPEYCVVAMAAVERDTETEA